MNIYKQRVMKRLFGDSKFNYSNVEKKELRNELMTIKKKESEAEARLKQITNPLKASIERLKV